MGLALYVDVRIALIVAMVLSAVAAQPPAETRDNLVLRIRVDDQAITPIVARFIDRAITAAEQQRARYLLIELDTPGGVVDATRQIVRRMLKSSATIVVYISPSGARAASAGLFITLTGHVAAMAPGTHIGAAHPVRIGGGLPGIPTQPDKQADDVMEQKILNDTQAWARSLAQLRGRNVEVAERAVSESRSLTATEAEREGLIDFVATDLDTLLERLNAANTTIQDLNMDWGQRLLAGLANPNVAFILLLLGFYGVIFEFYSAGFGVTGVVGAICIILALVGLAVLPLSYAGLALMAIAMGLFVAEAFVVSFGLLTVGGVVCLILGGLMLVDSPPGFARVSTAVVVPTAIATGLVAAFLLGSIVKAHRGRVQTGHGALMNERAVAQETFVAADDHYKGTVWVHGEYWNAISQTPVTAHDVVLIQHRNGLVLSVLPAQPNQP